MSRGTGLRWIPCLQLYSIFELKPSKAAYSSGGKIELEWLLELSVDWLEQRDLVSGLPLYVILQHPDANFAMVISSALPAYIHDTVARSEITMSLGEGVSAILQAEYQML